jgi:Tfp pilus assembly protein PilO
MNTNSSTRLWIIGSMLLVIAIVAMGWFLGVSPKLAEAATAGQQKSEAEAQNVVHESEIAVIKKQFDQLPALKSQLAVLRAAVPAGNGMSAFLDELHALEQQNQVSLTDFKAGDGEPYTPVKSTVPTVSTTNPLITADNFVAIPVSVTVSGDNTNIMRFVDGVQTGDRLFLVTSLKLDQDKAGATTTTKAAPPAAFTATISGFVYVLLDKPATPAKTGAAATTPATAPKG